MLKKGLWLSIFMSSTIYAQAELASIPLTIGVNKINAELANTEKTRQQGLMFRTQLAEQKGMLFVFEQKMAYCFWMRNTLIPLSIAFLNDDGTVVSIADMQPQTDDSHCAALPVRYALEMNQGWFQKRNIKPGQRVQGLPQ